MTVPAIDVNVPQLLQAMSHMADCLHGIDTGGTFGSFSCIELDSIARALAEADFRGTAAFVVMQHAAESEEDGDSHFHITERIDATSWDDPEAARLADEYVRQLLTDA
jgi:hypothetical protein